MNIDDGFYKSMEQKVLEENKIDYSMDGAETKTRVLRKLWSHLDQNFHKYSEPNQIKIMIALCTKDMPTQLDGQSQQTIINIIKAQTSEEKQKESIVEHGRRLSINT